LDRSKYDPEVFIGRNLSISFSVASNFLGKHKRRDLKVVTHGDVCVENGKGS
jgi:hypothetical protein